MIHMNKQKGEPIMKKKILLISICICLFVIAAYGCGEDDSCGSCDLSDPEPHPWADYECHEFMQFFTHECPSVRNPFAYDSSSMFKEKCESGIPDAVCALECIREASNCKQVAWCFWMDCEF